MDGHWFVTPRVGKSRKFSTTKAMVEFLRRHTSCMVVWVKTK